MKRNLSVAAGLVCCLAVVALLPGCQTPPPKAPREPVTVTVFQPVEMPDVVDYMYFTGHARSVQAVDVKPRVSGYLNHIYFDSGGAVRGPSYGATRPRQPQAIAAALGHLRP